MPTMLNRFVSGVVVAAATALGLGAQAPDRFSVADIARIVRLSDPQLSPDGRSIALVVARADTAKNIWVYELVWIEAHDEPRHSR